MKSCMRILCVLETELGSDSIIHVATMVLYLKSYAGTKDVTIARDENTSAERANGCRWTPRHSFHRCNYPVIHGIALTMGALIPTSSTACQTRWTRSRHQRKSHISTPYSRWFLDSIRKMACDILTTTDHSPYGAKIRSKRTAVFFTGA